MKPIAANFLNAFILIIAGIYGYFFLPLGPEEKRSVTALIPAFSGLVFLLLGFIWPRNSKLAAHIAATLALVLIVMCLMRFLKIEGWNDKKTIFLVCILSNLFALFVFVRSFIQARVLRKTEGSQQ